MQCQDARLNTTTESLNNIKILKLYSWTDTFEKAIQAKRKLEMSVFWKRLMVGMMNVTSLYFFPQVLSAVVFSVFIATGHHLELGMAYTVMTCLNLLREPMRYFPYFIGQFIELLVSMQRLQDFMLCDEINPGVVNKLERDPNLDTAIQIKHGNFFWGLEKSINDQTANKKD